MERHKFTISRELTRNTGLKGYRPKHTCCLFEQHSLGSRNSLKINQKDWDETVTCLHNKLNPEQITNQVGVSHETICCHIYADKPAGGSLHQQLRCQKKRKKSYASGRERIGQIIVRRPISKRPVHIETRSKLTTGKAIPSLEPIKSKQ